MTRSGDRTVLIMTVGVYLWLAWDSLAGLVF